MGWVRSTFGGADKRSTSAAITFEDLLRMGQEMGGTSSSGVAVSRDRALSVSAWWRGVVIRSSIPAKIGPPRVMRREGSGYVEDRKHPAHTAVSRFREMTAYSFYETRAHHRLAEGNGYAYVDRLNSGVALELIPLDPTCVQPYREGGVLRYLYTPKAIGEAPRKIDASNMFHTKGLGWDGMSGYPVWRIARDTLGASIAMREHGSKFFANGARVGLILEHPGQMSPEAQKKFLAQFNKARSGVDKAFQNIMLEEGMKLSAGPTVMNAQDAQLIESRAMEIREIANYVGVPAHRLGDVATRTYASAEQDYQVFLEDTVDPDLVELEQALSRVLLTDDEQQSEDVVIRFDRTRLGRADVKSQAEADKSALAGVPYRTIDEVRKDRGYAPLPDGKGAGLIIPINLVQSVAPGSAADPSKSDPTDPPEADGPEDSPPPADPADTPAARAVNAFVVATRARMLRRLTSAARAAGKHPAKFGDWLDGFTAEHSGVVREAFAPADGVLDAKAAASSLLAEVRGTLDAVYSTAKPAAFPEALEAALVRLES